MSASQQKHGYAAAASCYLLYHHSRLRPTSNNKFQHPETTRVVLTFASARERKAFFFPYIEENATFCFIHYDKFMLQLLHFHENVSKLCVS